MKNHTRALLDALLARYDASLRRESSPVSLPDEEHFPAAWARVVAETIAPSVGSIAAHLRAAGHGASASAAGAVTLRVRLRTGSARDVTPELAFAPDAATRRVRLHYVLPAVSGSLGEYPVEAFSEEFVEARTLEWIEALLVGRRAPL